MKAIKEQINKFIKLTRQKVVEIYEVAYIENTLIFKIDNEPIQRVDTPAFLSIRSSTQEISIPSNSTKSWKKKFLASISLSKKNLR